LETARERALAFVESAKAALPADLPSRAAFALAADGVVSRYS
jgi:hypothetical protein